MRKTETDKNNKIFVSRRGVLMALGSLGLMSALAGLVRASLRFLTPPVSQAQAATVIAGPPTDFPLGILTPLPHSPVFIGRDEAGLFALSAVCTHLGCTVARSDEGLACGCHGSHFAANGANLSGPATRPLPYLALRRTTDGQLEVNLNRIVEPTFRLK